MNAINPWLYLVPIGGLFALLCSGGSTASAGDSGGRERESFRLQDGHLEKLFFERLLRQDCRAARWVSCTFSPEVVFAGIEEKAAPFVASWPSPFN
jgi:hypothetical protein